MNLCRNKIGAQGAKLIAGALRVNASLTSINVGSNSLMDEGAEFIAAALKESATSKLQTLGIYSNCIGPKGATALAAYMAVSGSLTQVLAFCRTRGCFRKMLHASHDY